MSLETGYCSCYEIPHPFMTWSWSVRCWRQ